MLVDEIAAIKNNPDLSDEEKTKAVRKLRRRARVGAPPPPEVSQELLDQILEDAKQYPVYNTHEQPGYALSMNSLRSMDPIPTFEALQQGFKKRMGHLPTHHAVIVFDWDTLLLLAPVT